MTHAHGKSGKRCIDEIFELVTQIAESNEKRTGINRLIDGWWDAHQTLGVEMRQPCDLFGTIADLLRGESKFCGFTGDIDFQKATAGDSLLYSDAADVGRQLKGINAVNQGEERECLSDFVFLQVAYEVPLEIGWQEWDLGPGFLDTIFAEMNLACCGQWCDSLGRMGL